MLELHRLTLHNGPVSHLRTAYTAQETVLGADLVLCQRVCCSFNVNVRGDIDKQLAAAEQAAMTEGRTQAAGLSNSTAKGPIKHTWWWRLAHVSDCVTRGHPVSGFAVQAIVQKLGQ
jgi:hypothetical protein